MRCYWFIPPVLVRQILPIKLLNRSGRLGAHLLRYGKAPSIRSCCLPFRASRSPVLLAPRAAAGPREFRLWQGNILEKSYPVVET